MRLRSRMEELRTAIFQLADQNENVLEEMLIGIIQGYIDGNSDKDEFTTMLRKSLPVSDELIKIPFIRELLIIDVINSTWNTHDDQIIDEVTRIMMRDYC